MPDTPVPPEIVEDFRSDIYTEIGVWTGYDDTDDAVVDSQRDLTEKIVRLFVAVYGPIAAEAVYGDIVAERDAEIARLRGELERTEKMVGSLAAEYLAKHGQTSAERDAALAEVERLRDKARHHPVSGAQLSRWHDRAVSERSRPWRFVHRLTHEVENLQADRDQAVRDARRDALQEAVDAIEDDALRTSRVSAIRAVQIRSAARIVAGLRDRPTT